MDPSEPVAVTREELAVDPPQPGPVVRALETLLAESRPAVDPWWRAGNDEALGR
jgi:hypothetical protein